MVSMHNLLTDYGAITKANMIEAQTAPAEGTQCSCQNVLMMYQSINTSLTDEAKMQLCPKAQQTCSAPNNGQLNANAT